MTPLRVTALLDGATAFHHAIHLDALLAASVARRDDLQPACSVDELAPIDIPVARSACGRFYLATVGYSEVEAYEKKFINRRFPLSEAQWFGDAKIKTVNLAAGPCKMFRVPLDTRHLRHDRVQWWCVGDQRGVGDLLQLVTHLGRRRAVGLGRVVRWTVEECDPWTRFPCVSDDGVAMRNLPLDVPGIDVFDRDVQRLSPPYWMHAGRVECAVPVAV